MLLTVLEINIKLRRVVMGGFIGGRGGLGSLWIKMGG